MSDFDDPSTGSGTDGGRGTGGGSGTGGGDGADGLPDGVRLQKVLANAGVASRRVSEDLIVQGRVRVNGEVVTELGRRIDPENDIVDVDGTAVQLDASKRYVMLNKPTGVVSSMKDDRGRRDLREFTRDWDERLYNVGRLDADTSGLLILTNDGGLAHVLAHPSFGVTKVYIAKVEGRVTAQVIARLTRGVELEDGPIAADKARLLDASTSSATGKGGSATGRADSATGRADSATGRAGSATGKGDSATGRAGSATGRAGGGTSLVELTLHSGRNRIVRRMMAEVGHPVIELVRRQFGPLHLGTLPVGKARELTKVERGALLTLSRQEPADDGTQGDSRQEAE